MAIYSPLVFTTLQALDLRVLDVAAGDRFSVFVAHHHKTHETEVYSTGHNMRGQLGVGYTRHLQDLTLIEDISNFKVKDSNGQ